MSSGSIGGIEAASISPDGLTIAVLGTVGLKVSPIGGVGSTLVMPFTTPISKVIWSSDSRFVIVPFLQGVIVVDALNGRNYQQLNDFQIIEVAVIPLSP